VDLTDEPEDDSLEHGTAVCGAVLYGPCNPGKVLNQPKIKVKSFRVFPIPDVNGLDLDLYIILDWIKEVVEADENQHIKTFILSFGPNAPVDDQEIDLFTVMLDQLAYDHDVLFVVAAGNDGDLQTPFNRIQPPSDTVNGLGVGAYTFSNPDLRTIPAKYSCRGPGRPGSLIKPDICAFGGSQEHPFHVLLPGTDGKVAGCWGTSFAAPLIGAIAGQLLYRVPDPDLITCQTAKALIIHHAKRHERWEPFQGWGPMSSNLEELMACSANEVKVLYNGIIDFTRWVRLKIPFPDDLQYNGLVHFQWTFAYACGICEATPDDYTLAGKEIYFRPHSTVFPFSKKGQNSKYVNIKADPGQVNELQDAGWKMGINPKTSRYMREQLLRDKGKWDTIIKGKISLWRSQLNSPVLDIHALSRADWAANRGPSGINYAVVISIKVDSPQIKLYERVRARFPQLVPVELRARARKRIN
jgi:hypothetical protein